MKRSITIAGHRTSISMEPEFWEALKQISAQLDKSVPQIVSDVDKARQKQNLSSAIRIFILHHFQSISGH